MSRQPEGFEKGIRVYLENSSLYHEKLYGTAAPTGTGEQAAAPIGSHYNRIGTGEMYIKRANVGDATDWRLVQTGATVARWRSEQVDVVTNDTQGAGTRDVVVSPFSDDDGTALAPSDFVVGHYVISDADGTPVLLEITNVSGDNVTFAVATPALVDGDAYITNNYLPDPDGQENKALVVFSDGVMVKVADIDWNFATGINLSGSFSKTNGTVTGSDTVESALEKLAANQEDLTTLSGVAQGAVDLGTFTGATIADSRTIKQALQDLETAYEETDQNVDDLITLSGVAENATDHGTMDQGDILSDGLTTNALFKEVDAELTRQRGKSSSTGITGGFVTVDSVLVDNVANCQWNITVQDNTTPANKQHFSVFAGHNGTASADASAVDDSASKILKQGSTFNVQYQVVLIGTGASQTMALQFNSTDTIDVYAKRVETLY